MGNGSLKPSTLRDEGPHPGNGRQLVAAFGHAPTGRAGLLNEEVFHGMLTLERRRAERSHKPFALMLVDSHAVHKNGNGTTFIERLTSIVAHAVRETDIIGWYEEGAILAVIFTEIGSEGKTPITQVLHSKVVTALRDNFGPRLASALVVTVHLFPESKYADRGGRAADIRFYPDLSRNTSKKRGPMVVKRAIDILGSCTLLLIFSPLLAIIALAIKLTSKGPVIFQQERLGQFGTRFKCLKFRTMYTDNDPRLHREFVQSFITGKARHEDGTAAGPALYKITGDPRVTPLGRLLRKTSLDEFPQFWNVLRGEMSLVGPRPPVPYEFDVYDVWHRRRVLEAKPGVTGLWQVRGRSHTSFDDMVRLDLRYAQSWTLWLDLKILLATPRAVLSGDGAC